MNEKSNAPPIPIDDSRESKEDESIVIVTVPPPKTTPIPPMQAQKPVAPFPIVYKVKTIKRILIKSRKLYPRLS